MTEVPFPPSFPGTLGHPHPGVPCATSMKTSMSVKPGTFEELHPGDTRIISAEMFADFCGVSCALSGRPNSCLQYWWSLVLPSCSSLSYTAPLYHGGYLDVYLKSFLNATASFFGTTLMSW